MAFHFVKPAGFDYQAGQSIDLTLLNPPETDAEGNTRTFTLASAPFDSDLMITTRMRDTAFKRVMRKASPGLEVKLEGPSGSFVLHRKVEACGASGGRDRDHAIPEHRSPGCT
jgi:ferredoxin-NADP reductase